LVHYRCLLLTPPRFRGRLLPSEAATRRHDLAQGVSPGWAMYMFCLLSPGGAARSSANPPPGEHLAAPHPSPAPLFGSAPRTPRTDWRAATELAFAHEPPEAR